MFFMQDIGLFLGPFFWGMIIDAFKAGGNTDVASYSKTFYLVVIPVLLSAVLYIVFRKVLQRNYYVPKEEKEEDQAS